MDEGQRRSSAFPTPAFRRSAQAPLSLLGTLILLAGSPSAGAEGRSPRLSEATELGTFNVGRARATVARVADAAAGGEVLRLDYTVPRECSTGLYAKSLPASLSAALQDLLRLELRDASSPASKVGVAVELKGTSGAQRIPVVLQRTATAHEQMIDWPAIGLIREIVVLVENPGPGETATGTLLIDVRFESLPLYRKLSFSVWARMGGVLAVSLLLWLLTVVLASVSRRLGRGGLVGAGEEWEPFPPVPSTGVQSLLGDLARGGGLVLIAVLSIATYHLGGQSALENGWACLLLAIAGVAVAAWWKLALAGRLPTASEVLQDALVSGLLASSSSALAILQAPDRWSDLFQLSQVVAAVTILIYHTANARWVATAGKHLSAAAAALVVGTPFVFGALTLLESASLVQSLGGTLTGGLLDPGSAAVDFVGRVAVVFCFNEAVALGLAMATKGKLLTSPRAHGAMLSVAIAAILASGIAAFGSGSIVAGWPGLVRIAATVLTTVCSQAGLWAEAYLVTGMLMDAIHALAPSGDSAWSHCITGMKKGMVYSGVFMGGLGALGELGSLPVVRGAVERSPITTAMLLGTIVFPLIKTIIESFDGSPPFFRRLARNYQDPLLALRGTAIGLGLGCGLVFGLPDIDLPIRAGFGFACGALAYAGVDLIRDLGYQKAGRGKIQAPRYYLAHAVLGGLIGAALGFYLDAAQISVVTAKFHRYLAAGEPPQLVDIYPLVSKWGHLNLGTVQGGVSLLFTEALRGVISWSTASWLFAINRTFMRAYFWKDATPIRTLFQREGLVQLGENMIQVMRWGLWMSPIIDSFLRPMGEPTWYNQDGAIRTMIATFQNATLAHEAFRAWSLQVFIYLLAYDAVRILIWLDHMGLRVATLVNLSFLGMDKLEQKLAAALAPAATARCIPEGVKRFTTWGPLLIPFYIPRGKDWDQAWSAAEALRSQQSEGLLGTLVSLSVSGQLVLLTAAVGVGTAAFSALRLLQARGSPRSSFATLKNREYEVSLRDDGEIVSRALARDCDLSRRSYDVLDPAGRALFLVETGDHAESPARSWPVIGNFPPEFADPPGLERSNEALKIRSIVAGVRTTVTIRLPDDDDPVELWTINVENLRESPRKLKLVPYLEWVLNRPEADRGHTQYNRLFAQIEYSSTLHAVLAQDEHAKAVGILACDRPPEGFLASRMDFIGRARSLWTSRVLETLEFKAPRDAPAKATLDPIGSLLVDLTLSAGGSAEVCLVLGMASSRNQAIEILTRHLPGAGGRTPSRKIPAGSIDPIGHGEIPPGTPLPYAEFSEDGSSLLVHTPFTPRPFDHTLSNENGHVLAVTNRGLHSSCSVNSQQNRLTPDWADIVTREVPGEAIYLHDLDDRQWYSPTFHPSSDTRANYQAEFRVDGTAIFRMSRGPIQTTLSVFVPPDDPAGVYLLEVTNQTGRKLRLRLASYFQIVLASQPEYSGPLQIHTVSKESALLFENPRNTFRSGPAFAALSLPLESFEIQRGRFLGPARSFARPFQVEHGSPDTAGSVDLRPIAGLLATLEVPAFRTARAALLLGQANTRREAEAIIRKYQDPSSATATLQSTRQWWLGLLSTLQVRTSRPEFDRYLDWLKYQALAERIWARRGFYQASGAYGFRDQLQDAVNLIWMDPAVARKQILLHASHQFFEGDVVHWFHRLQDGRTGFVGRTHASDNLLWLPWAAVEYVAATGDESLLDETATYLDAEQPFDPLPQGKHGIGFDPLRSTRADTVYRHCLKAIDLVLDRRMGSHGLPLMGTGDWNDGLDEIGSQGRGESVWLGFFLHFILNRMAGIIARKEGPDRSDHYHTRLRALEEALELTWRGDRYLRAFHDDGTEIGAKGSGVWEIDALCAAWAVLSGLNPGRGKIVFDTALHILEKDSTILLGWPPLRQDTKPYLGRSSLYPEGVRENGMYCHGVQWLISAARLLAERAHREGDSEQTRHYLDTAYRLWLKTSPISHTDPEAIETYGGQPNKQAADMVTTFDPGRMIWNGYTGAAGWMFRQALEGVLGLRLDQGKMVVPVDLVGTREIRLTQIARDLSKSPFPAPPVLRPAAQLITTENVSQRR